MLNYRTIYNMNSLYSSVDQQIEVLKGFNNSVTAIFYTFITPKEIINFLISTNVERITRLKLKKRLKGISNIGNIFAVNR